jgi:glycosyltransferase involved in cell wall biosynthesis
MRGSDDFEPCFLAKGGPPLSSLGRTHSGTLLAPINGDPNQYFIYTDGYPYDWLFGTTGGKDLFTRHFHEFLSAVRPDIVHFQHTLFLGYDILQQVKNTLPEAGIVYTLHEYLPICHRQGQMVRTLNNEPCREASPRRCHECFPDITPQSFFLRKRFIQSQLSLVDRFIAPSRFLLERYVEWGIPRERIHCEDYGRQGRSVAANAPEDRPRNRLGYFGQLHPFKGVDVLLKAMKILTQMAAGPARAPDSEAGPMDRVHLWIHGANLDLQPGAYQNEFKALLEATKENVTLVGRYDSDDLPRLMARVDWVIVPSVWWENSPLVIQEAFQHGRPVLCSDIGGMAEKVAHGVNGLHFPVADPAALAQTIGQAVASPELWEKLRRGIPAVHSMPTHVRTLTAIYNQLLERTSVRG